MKNILTFCLKIFNFSVINFSVYVNRYVFVMNVNVNLNVNENICYSGYERDIRTYVRTLVTARQKAI